MLANAFGVPGFNRKVHRELRRGRGVSRIEALCFMKVEELYDPKVAQRYTEATQKFTEC